MPTSNLELAPRIVRLVETADPHRSILDVGPGYGKYGILLREYLNRKPERLDAIEVEPSYVTPRLEALYWTRADFHSVRPVEADLSSLGGIVVRLGPMHRK